MLLIFPELSLIVVQNTTPFARFVRTLMALWIIFGYVSTGISFIPNLGSSPIGILNMWGKYYNLLDERQQPIYDRSIFPFVYFFSTFFVSLFTSIVLLMAISSFAELPTLIAIGIALVNFMLFFLPHSILCKKALQVIYSNEPF